MKIRTLLLLTAWLGGCVSNQGTELTPILETSIEPITYDYSLPNVDKDTLFFRARDHFATVYGDSKSVIRVEDTQQGLILGKGAVGWKLYTGSITIPYIQCTSNYNVRFMAKEFKARLQLELINGAPIYSKCSGWPLPTSAGYDEILLHFNDISLGVKKALDGSGSLKSFKDF